LPTGSGEVVLTRRDEARANRRRLFNARAYLTDYLRVHSSDTIITAEGERTKDYGRLEIYVDGKLFQVISVDRNADFIVGSCEPEAIDTARQRKLRLKLYPWRDRVSGQR
jgi:hypothetical protein